MFFARLLVTQCHCTSGELNIDKKAVSRIYYKHSDPLFIKLGILKLHDLVFHHNALFMYDFISESSTEKSHEYKDIMISNTVFNKHENVLAEARFELTPSGFRSAALPIELFSPTGICGEFYLLKCTKIFSRQLYADP